MDVVVLCSVHIQRGTGTVERFKRDNGPVGIGMRCKCSGKRSVVGGRWSAGGCHSMKRINAPANCDASSSGVAFFFLGCCCGLQNYAKLPNEKKPAVQEVLPLEKYRQEFTAAVAVGSRCLRLGDLEGTWSACLN